MTHNQLESNNVIDYLVIGAGPAGIGAARTLRDAGKDVAIFEQNHTYGGLCDSFQVAGCSFDKFVHLSFAPEKLRNSQFNATPLLEHSPVASNFYNDKWLKHPAIKNLAPLSLYEKFKVLDSFARRPVASGTTNYGEWIKEVYGEYFATEFVEKYTRKYWGVIANKLDTSWVGNRFELPTSKDIWHGMMDKNTKASFYTGQMYYPTKHENGRTGYVQILDKPADGLKIYYNQKCVVVDPTEQICVFNTGYTVRYNHLISTMPLPYMAQILTTCLSPYKYTLVNKFKHTSGCTVSMVFNEPKITDKLWFYVYDEDITAARFYSPSLLCPENVSRPGEMSTLQGEIYFASRGTDHITPADNQTYINNTIKSLKRLGISDKNLLAIDIKHMPYANIIFDAETHTATAEVMQMLNQYNIKTCGRFGKWEYLWSHQAYMSGVETAKHDLAIKTKPSFYV